MQRNFLPQDFKISTWDLLKPYFNQLVDFQISTPADFKVFLAHLSEVESVVSEDLAWRYIKMTCDSNNAEIEQHYIDFVTNIQPNIAPFDDKLNNKVNDCPFAQALKTDSAYKIYFRAIKNAIDLFQEKNIPLNSEIQTLSQKYGTINGAMSVTIDDKEQTLQQASNILKETDRERRKMAYETIGNRRLENKTELNELFADLIKLRHQVALNAGFPNFRDYMHQAMGRFDYTVKDCFDFHSAISDNVLPILKNIEEERRANLGFETLKPYDFGVDVFNRQPLKPFETGQQLLDKTIQCFEKLDVSFADNLRIMAKKGFLDLESRIGKAPGGYNYPLAESGVPFIFMNAAGSLRDVETMVHEGGHAMHSFLTEHLELSAFKNAPMEVAEVASMAMELISMDAWDAYFANENDLKRAKIEQLEGVISTLPWIATIDAFQHWIYTNPEHTQEERTKAWLSISSKFDTGNTDFSGYESFRENSWQKQLHLFEVPFYYIEYGFAQLGAIAIWRNFVLNKNTGLDAYKNMLSLGYTKTIPELYETAIIRFDFSSAYVKELFDFVKGELKKLKDL